MPSYSLYCSVSGPNSMTIEQYKSRVETTRPDTTNNNAKYRFP